MELCHYELRTPDQGCICSGALHNMWEFGAREKMEADAVHGDRVGSCLCCEEVVYQCNENRCDDCGCLLCHKCFVRGRYDCGELSNVNVDIKFGIRYCYSCRRFGYLKNELYWTSNAEHLWVNRNAQQWVGTSFVEIAVIKDETIENWCKGYNGHDDWQFASWYY